MKSAKKACTSDHTLLELKERTLGPVDGTKDADDTSTDNQNFLDKVNIVVCGKTAEASSADTGAARDINFKKMMKDEMNVDLTPESARMTEMNWRTKAATDKVEDLVKGCQEAGETLAVQKELCTIAGTYDR